MGNTCTHLRSLCFYVGHSALWLAVHIYVNAYVHSVAVADVFVITKPVSMFKQYNTIVSSC